MGVIKRQGIKQSIVNYLAVVLGAISTLYIYPLDLETVGLVRFLLDVSFFLSPFLMLGLSGVTIRFFPYFEDEEKGHNGFLFLLLSGGLFGSSIFLLISWLFWDDFAALYVDKSILHQSFLIYIIPLSVLLAFTQLLYTYSNSFKRIVVPAIFTNFIKVTQPIVILLLIWGMISLGQLINVILLNFVVVLVGMLTYLFFLGKLRLRPDFSMLDAKMKGDMARFALFGLFMGVGNVLVVRIDSMMISTFIDFESNGVYTIAAFIGNAIAIPSSALRGIAAPIVSEAFKDDNLAEIAMLYRRVSINLLAIGGLLFVGMAVMVQDLFAIMPNNQLLVNGTGIVVVLGLAKVLDMGSSINDLIISYSKHYRFGFYAVLLMSLFNVICNYIFIQWLGIIGVAIATLASMFLYNLVKFLFVWSRFRMQPFTWPSLHIVLLAVGLLSIGLFLPRTDNAYLNIILRSIVVGGSYLAALYYFNLAPDLTEMAQRFFANAKSKLK